MPDKDIGSLVRQRTAGARKRHPLRAAGPQNRMRSEAEDRSDADERGILEGPGVL